MIKVLFVCAGNICRSPMAEGVFQDMISRCNLNDAVMVESAGTGSWHIGESAHSDTRRVLAENNIQYSGWARQVRREDLDEYDYILAMDRSNLRDIQQLARDGKHAEICLFLSYAQKTRKVSHEEVPDPYYDGNFGQVYELVVTGNQSFLKYLCNKHDFSC